MKKYRSYRIFYFKYKAIVFDYIIFAFAFNIGFNFDKYFSINITHTLNLLDRVFQALVLLLITYPISYIILGSILILCDYIILKFFKHIKPNL